MDEHRLDGNAAAGVLAEIFTFEITTARAACAHCGATGPLGSSMAYVSEIGTVVRCAACGQVLIRVVQVRGVACLDIGGLGDLRLAGEVA